MESLTEAYTYYLNDESKIIIHTDPAGLWKVGVSATIWDCSLILSKHFEKALSKISSEGFSELIKKPNLHMLELGAGCSALPSLVIANMRTSLSLDTRLTMLIVSDKAGAVPLLTKTVDGQPHHIRSIMQVVELDWTLPSVPASIHDYSLDVIIASDLLAFPDLYEPLISKLTQLASEETIIYIAYEKRTFEAEINFFEALGKVFVFEMVPEDDLDDIWRAPEEIYLYRAKKRQL